MRSGESVKEILQYWWPELISIALLIYIPPLIDLFFVASLGSTSTFGALDAANNFVHTFTKFAESIPVATMAIVGRHNGAKEYYKCGRDLGDTFWTTLIIGSIIFLILFFNAEIIYTILGVPTAMLSQGVAFLRLRSVAVLLSFIFISFLGFIKGVKNTRVPMIINIIGACVFLFFDYGLVLGRLGMPSLRLQGSALASIFQFSIMISCVVWYILTNSDYKKYFNHYFFMMFSWHRARRLLSLSWPIMIDKTSFSFAYLWMFKMIAPMGKYAIAAQAVIKNLQRIAFLPALAFAQIIIFLVSNRLGADDMHGARTTIKRVIQLALIMVSGTLITLCLNARYFISIFETKHHVTDFAAPLLPWISVLVVLDLMQVILAGSLRGAGDVRIVMWGRFFVCFFFFIPLSYFVAHIPLASDSLRFILIYISFYLSNGIMALFFFKRIVGNVWQKKNIE